MRIKPKLLLASIIILFLLCTSGVIYRIYFWSPQAKWDQSANKVIISSDPGCVHVGTNYIPTVQVWGDGNIIWVEQNPGSRRFVWEGNLTYDEMIQLVDRLISIGFFKFRFGSEKYCIGEYLTVSLSSISLRNRVSPENTQLSEIYGFLKTGAGVTSREFIPTTGLLYVYPVEEVDLPPNTEAAYDWPDEKYGYDFEKIHLHNNGQELSGDALRFAWEIVNSGTPVVKSNGKVYWIAVQIPGVFL